MDKNGVIVLQDGYCIPEPDGKSFRADCTVSLVKSPKAGYILVDTSGPWNKEKILEMIDAQGITINDITTVVCTHGHSDHVGNLNLFPTTCKLIVGRDISIGNVYEDFDFNIQSYKLASDIEVIATPGHTHSDVSVIVKNTEYGTIVIAGDLFESEEDLDDADLWKINSENPEVQEKNRQKILEIADYIVPGHGPIFAVKK